MSAIVRTFVLRAGNAYQRSLFLLPLFTFFTFFVVTWFIIAKGSLHFGWEKTPDSKKALISAIVASGTCLISIFIGLHVIKRKVARDMEAHEAEQAAVAAPPGKSISKSSSEQSDEEAQADPEAVAAVEAEAPATRTPKALMALRESRLYRSTVGTVMKGVNYDIHAVVETDARVAEIHASAEVFDTKAETSFKYLQVCTACANIFAHGSNEVANAVGPLTAIYQIWQEGTVSSKNDVPTWLLAIGGFAMVLGLATYGYRVMRSMGVKMTRLTNSRGFCVEICVAVVVILASRYGLPMSSTPATVGTIAGVGLLGGRKGFNGMLFLKFAAGWVITIVVAVALSCAFMAQALYSPNKQCASERTTVGGYLNTTATDIATLLNVAGAATNNAALMSTAQGLLNVTADQQTPLTSLIAHGHTDGGPAGAQRLGAVRRGAVSAHRPCPAEPL
ncbi:sodium phosphate symporter [Micractinium conductrix]|uniref:Phosphate transporter n=1 Tax=Micractinium conductrix TaxID=554055 RepID=A0A2P6VQ92_9CHLO|nr:sodium phosphate symporter [Micractinium conductrix]|eukprot:PSC76268.1 sodium phosphate symporter [Micractinium conductrix]